MTLNAGGGTLETAADLTLSGLIGGAGGLTKTGTSALTLTGANSYTGPTTVSAGSLFAVPATFTQPEIGAVGAGGQTSVARH
ncbi:autotransporter-associated beta strand repeat-containing protein [Mesorhizobium sp. 2RAF45]|uniref:autotransporter-associated beta strand repeat-containing protein n=1 Tax=Mesorhizobium sp. 2RAF45 TaxID=3233001 RepID=UPI003F95E474